MARNRKVWKYYVDDKKTDKWRAIHTMEMNSNYMHLIRDNPDDEYVPFWQSRIRKVRIVKEDQY